MSDYRQAAKTELAQPPGMVVDWHVVRSNGEPLYDANGICRSATMKGSTARDCYERNELWLYGAFAEFRFRVDE